MLKSFYKKIKHGFMRLISNVSMFKQSSILEHN